MCKSIICPRVLTAVCKHTELRGLVVQQAGSTVLIPLALDGSRCEPELGTTLMDERLLEMILVMALSDEYIQQLVASEVVIAAVGMHDVSAILDKRVKIFASLMVLGYQVGWVMAGTII